MLSLCDRAVLINPNEKLCTACPQGEILRPPHALRTLPFLLGGILGM